MPRPRVIPVLLLKGAALVKTTRFMNPVYVGDPINAVKLFNDLGVDELVLLDIGATRENQEPAYERIQEIVSEAFMPIAYGGGVKTAEQAHRLLRLGIEKVVITTVAAENPALIGELAGQFGSQSVIVGIDVKRNWLGNARMRTHAGIKDGGLEPIAFAIEAANRGAGEIFVNAIDRDGMMSGYDLPLIAGVARAVPVPVVACGGAASPADLLSAIQAGACGAAAGSLFVFKGPHRAVLINYPTEQELDALFATGAFAQT